MTNPPLEPTRRTAVPLPSAAAVGSAVSSAAPVRPLLATRGQVEAEALVLELLRDPELERIQAQLKDELAATPRGRTPDAAATLEGAIAQWTNSLIFTEIHRHRPNPTFLYSVENTPRQWLGHTLGGVATAVDNPDAIMRTTAIDGSRRYEIVGRFDPDRRAAQLVMQVSQGDFTQPATRPGTGPDVTTIFAVKTDRDLLIEPDGSFRITFGAEGEGPNHVATPPGLVTVGVRDMLSDWTQRPTQLAIHCLDGAKAEQLDVAALKQSLLDHLPGYLRFWGQFPDMYGGGGMEPNSIQPPAARTSGWGFFAGLRFELQPGQAMVVTTGPCEAGYTGFQVVDPWLITPDATRHQASLNLSQAVRSPDGSTTYVIAPADPGVANWLDAAGLHNGYGGLRWQALPPGAKPDGLIREFRIVSVAELAGMPMARVSPQERHAQLAVRAQTYASRTT
jgi:hypothetical protein